MIPAVPDSLWSYCVPGFEGHLHCFLEVNVEDLALAKLVQLYSTTTKVLSVVGFEATNNPSVKRLHE